MFNLLRGLLLLIVTVALMSGFYWWQLRSIEQVLEGDPKPPRVLPGGSAVDEERRPGTP